MDSRLDDTLNDPAAQPFLPLLFAALEDGHLDEDERNYLRATLAETGAGDILVAWLDEHAPPAAQDVALLGHHVREQFDALLSPVDLGAALDPSAKAPLVAAEDALGPFNLPPEPRAVINLAPLPNAGEAGFDLQELRSLIDGPDAETKERLRAILSRTDFRYQYDIDKEMYRALVLRWTQILADEEIGGLGMPSSVGGSGNPGAFIAAFQTIAHHDHSLLTKFGVQFGLYGGAIMRLGTERHHSAYLGDASSLATAGCFAMTETGHGSNVADLETTATFDPATDELVINTPHDLARKDYIGNAAADGRQAAVFARLIVAGADHGVHCVVVPLRSPGGDTLPGIRIEDCGPKAGLNGVDNGRIWFNNVRVSRSELLDRFAQLDSNGSYTSTITSSSRRFFTTLGTLVGGRVSVGAASISAAETSLAIAVRYATRRRQFGAPGNEVTLLDYPSHQRRLLPRLATTYAYHFAFQELISDYLEAEANPDGDRRQLEGAAAGLKAFGTWHAMDTVQAAREACGGQGYLAENRFGTIRSDIDVFTTYEGDNTVLAQLLAKALLTGYRANFEDMSASRIIRYLSRRVGTVLTESVPMLGAISDVSTAKSQRALLKRREKHSVETLARRIRDRISAGGDPAEAFVAVQPHTLHAARAHVERNVLRAINNARRSATDPELANLLRSVASLYALSRVEDDAAWFIQHGALTTGGARDVTRAVDHLCAELRPHARHLVDAFGIPDEMLAAPIAL